MKKLFIVCALLCIATTLSAQNKKKILGFLVNSFTKEAVIGTRVALLRMDSTLIDSTMTQDGMNGTRSQAFFVFDVQQSGKYLIRCLNENYETAYIPVDVKFHKREPYINLGTFDMKRKSKKKEMILGEVVVKATKVKLYMDGDTVVYNADAFQLSEGSMLDALIEQLPGAELKDDGRIFFKGKYVESLLLNGKDFFRNDRKVMLDNLPSYMVNKIKVYEKGSDFALLTRQKGDKQIVMDVNLKREYSIGFIANAEAATGSKDRYLGRLFALRFTPHSRLSFFGNMNNLNENRTPGKNGEWTPSDLSNGLIASKVAGLDYWVDDKDRRWQVNGNARIEHADADNQTQNTIVNFLPEGDTYGRSWNLSRSCNTHFVTDHAINFMSMEKQAQIVFYPHLEYSNYHNNSSYCSGTFSNDPSKYISSGLLDSLNSPNAGEVLRRIGINRISQNILGEGYNLQTNLRFSSDAKVPHSNDFIHIEGSASYENAKNNLYTHYKLDYPSNSSSSTDFRNQYSKAPERSYDYSLKAEYSFWFPHQILLIPYYQYVQSYHSNQRSLYRLDRLQGWGEGTSSVLGTLPSTTDSLGIAVDMSNSYYAHQHDYLHKSGVRFEWNSEQDKEGKEWNILIDLPVSLKTNRLNYQRAALDTLFSRHTAFFEPSLKIQRFTRNKRRERTFQYNSNSSAPSMTYLLKTRDDSNPLYIMLGNANLKNIHLHNFSFYYGDQLEGQKFINFSLNYSVIQDALAIGSVYDKTTGVRTTTPDNVNGNWNSSADVNFSRPLDKAQRLTFSTNTRAAFYNSVDLVSLSGSTTSARSTVASLYLTENLKADYRISSKAKVGAKIKGVWTHATSDRQDFSTINSVDFNYGLTGQIEFPWNMQFSTDITEYSRRGYESSEMNTNELVWNARLSKRVMHGNLTFMLDGFDILGNLSNVRRTINVQARTETYYNVIPRYVMLHAIYRLNLKPSKK